MGVSRIGRGNEAFNDWSDTVLVDVNAARCCMPSTQCGAWSLLSYGPLLGLRCEASACSSCRRFLMAASYPPPGSRRASYRAKLSFRRGILFESHVVSYNVTPSRQLRFARKALE